MEHDKRLRNIQIGLPGNGRMVSEQRYAQATPNVTAAPIAMDAGLVTASHPLAQWMAHKFNHNFDEYDRAIDSVYNTTHVGGSSYHHLLDGQHSIWGAFESVKDVKADDSFLTEFSQAGEHLLRDLSSVSGISPFFQLTKEQFDNLAGIAQNFGISKPFLADALMVNGPELLGGMLGLMSIILVGKKRDPFCVSKLSGAYVLSSVASGNPALFPIAAGGLIYAAAKSENKKEILVQGGKGAIVSGGALLAGSLVGGPVWIGCLASIAAAISINTAIENPEKTFKRVQGLITPASVVLRKVTLSLK